MSNKVHATSSLLSLQQKKPKSYQDRFHEAKAEVSNYVLSWAYRLGLGYTTLAESYEDHKDDLFREIVVEAQGVHRNEITDIFSIVMKGNLYEVTQFLNKVEGKIKTAVKKKYEGQKDASHLIRSEIKEEIKKSAIYYYDAAGANIVHIAYLCMHYHIGHYLVKRYPYLACAPYTSDIGGLIRAIKGTEGKGGARKEVLEEKWESLREMMALQDGENAPLEEKMLYTGENILHMTIIRRNYDEVRWLLDFYRDHRHSHPGGLGKLLNTHATGKFFDPRGTFYFGSSPLQFAVCCNSTSIFDLVYSFVSANDESYSSEPDPDNQSTTTHSMHFVGPEVIFATDKFGNNILHLCVLHGLDAMYEHVYNTALQVMARRIQSFYIARSEQQPVDYSAFTLDSSIDEEEMTGYVMKETVLHMPTDPTNLQTWLDEGASRKVDERMVLALNADFHSPLTLAASIIDKKTDSPEVHTRKVEMFRFLVDKMKRKLWDYGPVTMSILNLDGIEIKYDVLQNYECAGREHLVRKTKIYGAIWWLCLNDADKAISIPEIEQLIQAKWERVGYPLFILSFLINTFLTTCVTLILIFINATPTRNVEYNTAMVANVLYAIVALAFFIMMMQELHDFFVFHARIVHFHGVSAYDKVLRILKIFSFVAFCCCKAVAAYDHSLDERYSVHGATVLYNVRDDQGIKVTMVVCVIACYFHLYYFFMGFDSTGPFVLTMFRIISKDVPYFLNFYLIVVVAFGCALSMLSNDNNSAAGYGFFMLLKAVWTLIQNTVGVEATHDNINTMDQYPKHLQWLADILLTTYSTSVIILMLNLLIAMISNTYNAYCEYNGAILLMAKYNMMNAMEWVMWPSELKANRAKYAQIDETQVLQTVNEKKLVEESSKLNSRKSAKPVPGSGTGSASSRRPRTATIAESINQSAIDCTPLTRYLFEMQTVSATWCENSDTNASGDNNLADAVTAALGQIKSQSVPRAEIRKTTLFIIDPQADFHPGGSLAIEAAGEDSIRIARMIDDFGSDHIHDIFVSMDSHHPCHIAHAISWCKPDKPDVHPAPFTSITNDDVVRKVWVYRDPDPVMQEWVKSYTAALERKGRMVLTIWPEHCLIGSRGHSVVKVIDDALQRWAQRSAREVNYVMKGQNLRVEMYSALCAEVEDPLDQNTGFNHPLMSMLQTSDRVCTSFASFLFSFERCFLNMTFIIGSC